MKLPARWRGRLIRRAAQEPYRTWLKTQGSLTRRLQLRCDTFRVARVKQGLERPLMDETPSAATAWVREVVLYCDNRPVVFAHSVLPYRPLHPLDRLFRGLGNRALGSLLFTDPRFHRRSTEFMQVDNRHALYQRVMATIAANLPSRLWARRARFDWAGKSLWVTEVFLPDVLKLQSETR